MVNHNHFVEEELRKVLSDAVSELANLEKEREILNKKIAQLDQERQSYALALRNYLIRTGKYDSNEPDWNKLKELPSHKARLVSLAEFYGGNITVKDSSAMLFTKGIIKSKRQSNAYQIVRDLLEEMVDGNIFEKVGRGQYKLIGSQQSLPVSINPKNFI